MSKHDIRKKRILAIRQKALDAKKSLMPATTKRLAAEALEESLGLLLDMSMDLSILEANNG